MRRERLITELTLSLASKKFFFALHYAFLVKWESRSPSECSLAFSSPHLWLQVLETSRLVNLEVVSTGPVVGYLVAPGAARTQFFFHVERHATPELVLLLQRSDNFSLVVKWPDRTLKFFGQGRVELTEWQVPAW
ncbi:MAG: hypothetical protein Kow0069_32850 [Promethearchaeota archaeon]